MDGYILILEFSKSDENFKNSKQATIKAASPTMHFGLNNL